MWKSDKTKINNTSYISNKIYLSAWVPDGSGGDSVGQIISELVTGLKVHLCVGNGAEKIKTCMRNKKIVPETSQRLTICFT